MDRIHLLIWLSAVADAALSGWLLSLWLGACPTRPWAGRLLRGLRTAALVWLGKLALLFVLRLNPFGLIHLVYLDAVIVLPFCGAVVAWMQRGTRRGAAAASLCLLAPLGLYSTFVEPYRLQLQSARVPLSPARAGKETLRVGVLADIQTTRVTDYERGAVDRVMALAPDVILLPGDLFQKRPGTAAREIPGFAELMARLHAPGGVYYVLGDIDSRDDVEAIVRGTDVRLLVNEVARTTVRGRSLTIGGLEVDYGTPAAHGVVVQLQDAPGTDDVRILLAHRPDPALRLGPSPRVDLVVAGHTHGGQVQLPVFGPLMTLSGVPRHVAAGGLHDLGQGRRIYVSRGVGLERGQAPQLRFNCPPEISLLELGSFQE